MKTTRSTPPKKKKPQWMPLAKRSGGFSIIPHALDGDPFMVAVYRVGVSYPVQAIGGRFGNVKLRVMAFGTRLLSRDTGLNRRTLMKALAMLTADGWVECVTPKVNGATPVYVFFNAEQREQFARVSTGASRAPVTQKHTGASGAPVSGASRAPVSAQSGTRSAPVVPANVQSPSAKPVTKEEVVRRRPKEEGPSDTRKEESSAGEAPAPEPKVIVMTPERKAITDRLEAAMKAEAEQDRIKREVEATLQRIENTRVDLEGRLAAAKRWAARIEADLVKRPKAYKDHALERRSAQAGIDRAQMALDKFNTENMKGAA